jgi:uncharacterized protein YukE
MYADLQMTAGVLLSGREEMITTLTALQAKVDSLVAKGFDTDEASKAFLTGYKNLSDGVTQAVGGLEGMAEFLNSTATTYSEVDSDIAANIRG